MPGTIALCLKMVLKCCNLAIEILAINDISVAKKYELFRAKQYNEVVEKDLVEPCE